MVLKLTAAEYSEPHILHTLTFEEEDVTTRSVFRGGIGTNQEFYSSARLQY